MPHAAVIFDVDGPLLELTSAEEDRFFAPLVEHYGLRDLSRDWNSYRIRNDIEIYREILLSHLEHDAVPAALECVTTAYIDNLQSGYLRDELQVVAIPGASELLEKLHALDGIALGIATANLGKAAQMRLTRAGMWHYLDQYPGAAEAGGAKSNILASVLAELDIPKSRVVFLGDNLNDLAAGIENGVHFIGFHTEEDRRRHLSDAGAETVCGDHVITWELIREKLDLA